MTNQELKEKFKEWYCSEKELAYPSEIADWWLAERKALLGEIAEEIKKEKKDLDNIVSTSFKIECNGYNKALFDALTIIQSKE